MPITRLTVMSAQQEHFTVDVLDGQLILTTDGDFVSPEVAKYVVTMPVSITSDFKPFIPSAEPLPLVGNLRFSYKVCSAEHLDEDPTNFIDPPLETEDSPFDDSSCICGVTCNGPELTFVKVVPAVATN